MKTIKLTSRLLTLTCASLITATLLGIAGLSASQSMGKALKNISVVSQDDLESILTESEVIGCRTHYDCPFGMICVKGIGGYGTCQ